MPFELTWNIIIDVLGLTILAFLFFVYIRTR